MHTIRKATLKDIDNILQITKACAQKMRLQGIYQWNGYYPSREAFEHDVERQELYVLEKGRKLIGCIVISTLADEFYKDIEWLTEDGEQYYIHRLAVHPDQQGKGFAQTLMDYAENMARENNITSVRLDTFSKNERNQRFYEQRGYQRLGEIFFPKQSKFPFYCYELPLGS
ncbi:GNAT family N-acetyltransferase [Robertkochia marina]|uniref:GNAT family N-acetyltransferase n=1 Tax=Robertkochia marina TaxID=1227945 RepID=A0A4S3M4U1_9FLAO|nr:GNAT family N-acetyltransferase [Robertkochia marina]THD69217.1 GNAT family N-acetyltransferase [Robertkochia marina]TRZ47524.1 GNAT family N-acetyltransferase [Robertkochia marina]